MTVTTLKTLVLKTATVTGVKPATPADRIGLGLVPAATAYPTDNLSPGQFPLPQNPEPEQLGSRQGLSVSRMRMHLRAAAEAVPPVGSTGCPSAPGFTAGRSAPSASLPTVGWQRTTRAAAGGTTHAGCLHADPSRDRSPGDLRHDDRLGRDCQSPDRTSGKRNTTREVISAATAGK